MSDSSQRREPIQRLFQQRFGAAPTLWCRAPGRVDLMGSHTDYSLGYVLTLPIGRDTWMAARPRLDSTVRLYSLNLESEAAFSLDPVVAGPVGHWSNYVRGVAHVLQTEGLAVTGFDGAIHSTVPLSSGLSSSAALECVTATVFEVLGGWRLDPVRKALLCQRAEHQFVGVNCGVLDQYTSCLGEASCALLLDCRDLTHRPVKLPEGLQVVIGDTRSRRELAGSEYGQRRAQCEAGARQLRVRALREVSLDHFTRHEAELPPEVARRCRFIVEENDRVLRLAAALPAFDREAIGQLTVASFRGASDLYEIGTPAMRAMFEAMQTAPGAVGARQAGAGFGGCLVAFVEQAQVPGFVESVCDRYALATGSRAVAYPVEAAAGAGPL